MNGSLLTDEQLISLNQQVDIPLVHIGRSLSADAGYSIAVDQRLLIETAVDHLVEIGHRNIVYVGPTSLTKASIERSSAFAEVVSQFQSLNVVGTQIECLLGFEEGYEACKQLLEQNVRFSAVIGATDEVAAGCMSALKEAGIDVPGQVSVMGTDNDSFGAFMSPALTTIDTKTKEMVSRVMDVASQLTKNKKYLKPEVITGALVERFSTSHPSNIGKTI